MAFIILKRDRKRVHLLLGSYFAMLAFGFILNIIYANLYDEDVVYVLHFFTVYF